jgi:hypothetical protein
MSARELENRISWFPPLARELVLRYVEENPEAANDPDLVKHAFIAPLCRGAQQRGWSERNGWAFFERFLQAGAHGGGARLSPAECKLLLQIIRGERKVPTPYRRHKSAAALRESAMADYLELREADGGSPEAAVRKVQKVYGVARETVYAAKRKRKEEAALLELEPKGRNMTAEVRCKRIEFLERQAEKWRWPKRPRRSSPI